MIEIKNNWAFLLWYGVTKFAKFSLVKGMTFANPAAHPHLNYMGVPFPPPPPGATLTPFFFYIISF